jgi:hypothetical protein
MKQLMKGLSDHRFRNGLRAQLGRRGLALAKMPRTGQYKVKIQLPNHKTLSEGSTVVADALVVINGAGHTSVAIAIQGENTTGLNPSSILGKAVMADPRNAIGSYGVAPLPSGTRGRGRPRQHGARNLRKRTAGGVVFVAASSKVKKLCARQAAPMAVDRIRVIQAQSTTGSQDDDRRLIEQQILDIVDGFLASGTLRNRA